MIWVRFVRKGRRVERHAIGDSMLDYEHNLSWFLNWCGSDLSQQGNSEQSTPNSPTSVKFDFSSIRQAKSHFLKFTGFHKDIYQRIHVRTKEKCIRQLHFLEICTHRPHFKDKDIRQTQLAYLRGTGFVQDQKVTRLIVYSHIYIYVCIGNFYYIGFEAMSGQSLYHMGF